MNTKTIALLTITLLLTGAAASQTRQTVNLNTVLIGTDPVPVQSGDDAEINFKIRNTGNTEAQNVKVQLVNSFPFKIKPDRKVNYSLGNIAPTEEYQISTEVLVAEEAPDGKNSLKVKITSNEITTTQEIPIQVQSQDIQLNLANLKTSPQQLTPDTEDAKITIELVNNGEKTAKNTVVNLALPKTFQQTSSFSTRQALGNLAAGEVKTAEFNFDISKTANKGRINIPVNLTYSAGDSNKRITEQTEFSFHLAGKPQYKITNIETGLEAGSKGQIKLTIQNTGSEKSSSTRIRVLDSSDQPFSYKSASEYIGTIEPGQKGTVVFDTTVEKSATAKQYLIDFEIRGVKDTKVYVEDSTIPVEVQDRQKQSSLPILPLAAILIVAIAIFHFRKPIKERIR